MIIILPTVNIRWLVFFYAKMGGTITVDGYNFNLQEYCSYCGDFSPELSKIDITNFGDKRKRVQNNISCGNSDKCERIMEMLRRNNGLYE